MSKKNKELKKTIGLYFLFFAALFVIDQLAKENSSIKYMLLFAMGGYVVYCLCRRVKQIVVDTPLLAPEHNYITKIDLYITPHWQALLEHVAAKYPNSITPDELLQQAQALEVEYLRKNTSESPGIWGKPLSFQIEKHSWYGYERIWNEKERQFVDKMELYNPTFRVNSTPKDAPHKNLFSYLFLTPSEFGFAAPGIKGGLSPLSKIPYDSIIAFLEEMAVYMEHGAARPIKKFPQHIERELSQNNVKYEWWYGGDETGSGYCNSDDAEKVARLHVIDGNSERDSKQHAWLKKTGAELYNAWVDYHVFRTAFFHIGISMRIYKAADYNRRFL